MFFPILSSLIEAFAGHCRLQIRNARKKHVHTLLSCPPFKGITTQKATEEPKIIRQLTVGHTGV